MIRRCPRTTKENAALMYVLIHQPGVKKGFLPLLKQSFREFFNPVIDETVRFSVDEYSYIEKFPVPEYIHSIESAEEWFDECVFIEQPYSMYDCTGRPFTLWHKFAMLHGRLYCYHRICIDL